ncbi:MAG: cytidine/deoxycytidylate deaminase family protein, partial [Terriglobia bacterium]
SSERPSWDEYFMGIAAHVSLRSTCLRRKTGALIAKEKRILSTGYNGSPRGLAHCSELRCQRDRLDIPSGERHELCRGLHAEQNAVVQGALHGIEIEGATLYCTHQPCALCAKIIINAGISEVIYGTSYPDALAESLLAEAGIRLTHFR